MGYPACRSCSGRSGQMVLDLGEQPACDYFPRADDPARTPCTRYRCGSVPHVGWRS